MSTMICERLSGSKWKSIELVSWKSKQTRLLKQKEDYENRTDSSYQYVENLVGAATYTLDSRCRD